ncbi:MAG: PKD domain-containing protein, partial [Gammaproteobacteria bacterium]
MKKTDAEGVITNYSYNGLTVTATTSPTDSPTFTTQSTTNSLGKLLSTVDANGSDTEFRYDAQGNPVLIQDAIGHQTLAVYNLLGQKTSVNDPDMGNWLYVYDVLGNLVKQTDAKSQVITQSYDVLSRMTSRIQPEGTTNWCYDGPNCTEPGTAPDMGQLYKVTQYDGYTETYTYDQDSRVSNVDELINSTHYDTSTTYDADGRINTVTYPAGVNDTPPTVSAGSNQTVQVGTEVTLQGSAGSSDVNGGPPVSYLWTQASGPAASLTGATTLSPSFTPTVVGTYVFTLSVSDGLLSASANVTVTVNPPAPPTSPTLNPNPSINGSYTLSWTGSTGASSYDVYKSNGTLVASVSGTSEPFSGLGNGSYSYYVTACNDGACSTNSPTVTESVTLPPNDPNLSGPSSADLTVPLTWASGGGTVTSYQLWRSNTNIRGQWTSYANIYTGSATSHTDTLSQNWEYAKYYLLACNGTACSGYNSILTVTNTGWILGGCKTCAPTSAPSASSAAGPASAALLKDYMPSPVLPVQMDDTTLASAQVKLATASLSPPLSETLVSARAGHAQNRNIQIHYGPTVAEYYASAHWTPVTSQSYQAGLTVQYNYNSNGYMYQLSNGLDGNQVFWTANNMDAFDNLSQETYGNGVMSTITRADPMDRITGISSGSLQSLTYQWDALGNLTSRTNNLAGGASETFHYDILNRLTQAQVTNSNGVQTPVTTNYDAIGDITYKSNAGTYNYGGAGG